MKLSYKFLLIVLRIIMWRLGNMQLGYLVMLWLRRRIMFIHWQSMEFWRGFIPFWIMQIRIWGRMHVGPFPTLPLKRYPPLLWSKIQRSLRNLFGCYSPKPRRKLKFNFVTYSPILLPLPRKVKFLMSFITVMFWKDVASF